MDQHNLKLKLSNKRDQSCSLIPLKTVYTYCLDGHPQYDWILEYQTEYAGLGHAAELPLEFGNIDFWLYKEIFNGLDPEGWEIKMADFIQTEFSSFFKYGEPTDGKL